MLSTSKNTIKSISLLTDPAGNIYFGGSSNAVSGGSGYNRIKVKLTSGEIYTVIGTNTNATTADCTAAGCASTASIYTTTLGVSGLGVNRMAKIFDSRYNSGEGRLLFTEGSTIRFVSKPQDRLNSKLGTLSTQSGTAINFGRTVGGFVYTYVDSTSSQIDKVYYLSGNQLYCYKVSSGSDSSCTNTSLGPSSSLAIPHDRIITMDDLGNIYVVNASKNIILKYTP